MGKLTLTVVNGGMFTTVQDLGRPGLRRFGIPQSGAMDRKSCQWANYLVGNPPDAPVLEFTLIGGKYRFDRETRIALVGAIMPATLDGSPLAMNKTVKVPANSELHLGRATNGCRTYMAIAGRLKLKPVFGSYSTYAFGEFGGFEGRQIQAGDQLTWKGHNPKIKREFNDFLQPAFLDVQAIRVLPGPEWNTLKEKNQFHLLESEFTVDPQSTRMGVLLQRKGKPLKQTAGSIRSSATLPGTVQLPNGGTPIVLMADGQTSGGYPRVLQVIEVDLNRLAQVPPGKTIRFLMVDLEQAMALRERQQAYWPKDFAQKVKPRN